VRGIIRSIAENQVSYEYFINFYNSMKKRKKYRNMVDFVTIFGKQQVLFLLLIMIIPVSCAGSEISNIPARDKKNTSRLDMADTPFEIQETNIALNTNHESNYFSEISSKIPAEISPDNLKEIQEIARVSPFYVPYFEISSDGAIIAVGTEQTIFIVDGFSGETISEIPVKPPECNYGMGRYFRLNENGTFLGIVNEKSIEVWQVGGGKIHETEFSWKADGSQTSCGGYIPEISISPDGNLLAVSGKEYINDSPKQTFRVIDIPRNEVIYDWDGKDESLHGNLYTFHGLGFSADGKFIQTFDPKRFTRSQNNTHLAFRFWMVGAWRESFNRDFRIRESYPIGNLYYSLSSEKGLEIRTRLEGGVISRFAMNECSFEYPCETKFSPDGNRLAVLKQRDNQLLYRNQIFFRDVEIWDIGQENRIQLVNSLFRNLDGIHPDFPERISRFEKWLQDGENNSFWWISDISFEGLKKSADGKIYFVPRRSELENNGGCDFCTICQWDYPNMSFICKEGLLGFGGENLKIDTADGFPVIMIHDEKLRIVGELPFIIVNNSNRTNFYLLGFSEKYQIGFFCTDKNFREKRCMIYDFIDREPLYEMDDISYLRAS